MQLCDYRIPCDMVDCEHNHNYGDILLQEVMIANMYDQDKMARIMSNHKEAGEGVPDIIGAASMSNKRSDYNLNANRNLNYFNYKFYF